MGVFIICGTIVVILPSHTTFKQTPSYYYSRLIHIYPTTNTTQNKIKTYLRIKNRKKTENFIPEDLRYRAKKNLLIMKQVSGI